MREALEKEWEDAEDSSQEEDEGGGHREISFKYLQCVKYGETINIRKKRREKCLVSAFSKHYFLKCFKTWPFLGILQRLLND